ncbi:sensor histidine kinase [Tessaracoccus sp. OH4464_COT-324]|uniref:sensor histidine kinase n=1 Tax=Tessaracoccus sp. OH4464_COT-324 TaxID=2491059 RepID=UPI000F6423A3|nr:sensor histidine kinase [Tessaracoccus sp. OH4464_COT-324]RRD46408.1 sensor histidine kinase [Tessaracoccus sp. OH4464_COT-324]
MLHRDLPADWLRVELRTALALGVFGCLMACLSWQAGIRLFNTHLGLQMLGSCLMVVPLVWRRRYPLSAALSTHVLYILVANLTGIDIYASQIALFLAFYSIGAWSARRSAALVVRILIATVMFGWLVLAALNGLEESLGAKELGVRDFLAFFVLQGAINVAFYAGAWVFGNRSWQEYLVLTELRQARQDIEQLQAEVVGHAIEQERVRMARELHDVVAHHVTLMGVQAAAARRLLARNHDGAVEALKQVEAGARQAVKELQHLVLTLRESDADTSGLPTVDDVRRLVAEANTPTRPTTFEVIGGLPPLTPSLELTIYRLVQEALTNATKHAGPTASVAVRLRNLGQVLELEISDDGLGHATQLPGTGTGLIGMRERVAAVGGTLETGPKPLGGFRVRAQLPLGEK